MGPPPRAFTPPPPPLLDLLALAALMPTASIHSLGARQRACGLTFV